MFVCTANTKGGVGKSTIAVHLAAWFHDQGFRTALIDADAQRSSSQWITEVEPGITVVTTNTPDECLQKAQELLLSHDMVVGDGPGGLDDLSRTMLLLADLALLPISPSILDLRSVQQATTILRYAQGINKGKPEGCLILNKMRTRDTISRELKVAASTLGVRVASNVVRDLQAYRDAAQQGSVVSRMGKKSIEAASDMDALFHELVDPFLKKRKKVANG